jgi:hypothetical protein
VLQQNVIPKLHGFCEGFAADVTYFDDFLLVISFPVLLEEISACECFATLLASGQDFCVHVFEMKPKSSRSCEQFWTLTALDALASNVLWQVGDDVIEENSLQIEPFSTIVAEEVPFVVAKGCRGKQENKGMGVLKNKRRIRNYRNETTLPKNGLLGYVID